MTLRAVNLNLVPILRALLRERNVSRAAMAVGITQPAASKALAQLRNILDDQLLVRAGNTLALTPRAERLIQIVENAADHLAAIWMPESFDPGRAERTFVIAGGDYTALLVMPPLVSIFAQQAPHVSLRFVRTTLEWITSRENLKHDFAILPRFALCGGAGAVNTVPLLTDRFVPVVRKGHSLSSLSKVTADQILSATHNAYDFEEAEQLLPDARGAIAAGGRLPPVRVWVEQFSVLPILALLTDSVVIVPRRLAEILASQMSLHIIDEAEPRDIPIDLHLAWNTRHNNDPAHAWMRRMILEHVGDKGQV